MAIQQTKRQSDLEKRLQLLRRQVVGGQESKVKSLELRIKDKITTSYTSDFTYLRQDLMKILIFSSIAIGTQIILFILQNHILKLNFF